jgi:ankyrin repeat protein
MVAARQCGADPYQHAVRRGRADLAVVLAELGASIETDPLDEALGAIARGEEPSGRLAYGLDDDAKEVLILAALWGSLELVLDSVGPNLSGRVGGSPSGSLLHHAAWVGNSKIVGELLACGADPVARSKAEYDTPLAWAALASQYHGLQGRDYVAVAELLAEAGNPIEARFLDVAEGPLHAWLEQRLD